MARVRTKPKTRYYVFTCPKGKIHHNGIVPSDRELLKHPLKAQTLRCSCGVTATYEPSDFWVTETPA